MQDFLNYTSYSSSHQECRYLVSNLIKVPGELIQSTEQRIQEFLTRNRQSAYTPLEIIQGIYPDAVVDPVSDPRKYFVETALDSLLSKEVVVGKVVAEAGVPVLYFM